MRRRLFTLTFAVSLLLCLAAVGLWVRSYWVEDDVRYVFGPTVPTRLAGNLVRKSVLLSSSSGQCAIRYTSHLSVVLGFEPCIEDGNWFYTRSSISSAPARTSSRWLGFGWTSLSQRNAWEFEIPDYAIVGFCGVVGAISFVGAWRRKVHKPLCPSCHYNLTGNASGACPECGTVVTGKAGT